MVSSASHKNQKIAIVDGMVLVQKMTKKTGTITTVKDLGKHFNDNLMTLTAEFDEIILVFDTYKSDSLKQKSRVRRRQGNDPVQYQIMDDTRIKHIPLSRFLSHEQTKADLTQYLAEEVIGYNRHSPKVVITSASGHTRSNQIMTFELNNHEEADTLMICLATSASQRNPSAQLVFFSPDTDVLVLAVANYYQLCKTRPFPWYQVHWRSHQYGELWDQRRLKHYPYSMLSVEMIMLVDSQDWVKPSGSNNT